MYTAFVDDAATDDKSPYSVVAGIVVDAKAAKLVAGELADLFAHFRIDPSIYEFHATEVYHGKKHFVGRTRTFRYELLRRVLKLTRMDGVALVVGYALKPPAKDYGKRRKLLAFSEAYARFISELYKYMEEYRPGETVSVTMESGEYNPKIAQFHDEIVNCDPNLLATGVSVSRVSGRINFVTKMQSEMVWLADACAFAMNRYIHQKEHGEDYFSIITRGSDNIFPMQRSGGFFLPHCDIEHEAEFMKHMLRIDDSSIALRYATKFSQLDQGEGVLSPIEDDGSVKLSFVRHRTPQLEEDEAAALWNKGMDYLQVRDFESALRCFDDIIFRFSRSWDAMQRAAVGQAMNGRANCLRGLGRTHEALEASARFIEIYDGSDEPWLEGAIANSYFNVGTMYLSHGDIGQAVNSFRKIMDRFYNTSDLDVQDQIAMAIINLSCGLLQLGLREEAVLALQRMLAREWRGDSPIVQESVRRAKSALDSLERGVVFTNFAEIGYGTLPYSPA